MDCDGSQVCDEYFEYCTSFEISSVSKMTFSLCSYSQYVVYINGTFVKYGQYDGYENYQVYEALLGLGEECSGYVLQEIERIWEKMLFAGADTFWKTEKGCFGF